MDKYGDAISVLYECDDYRVLKRVPEKLTSNHDIDAKDVFQAAIIDLETMGLDPKNDSIIEIGLLVFSFSKNGDILKTNETYNGLQDPGCNIPEEITKITGITNEDVSGQSIDWDLLSSLLSNVNLIICHNSSFDRNFLELQTPDNIRNIIITKLFGCTMKDIDWKNRGYESPKLEFLNYKLGYFYDGHRALVDCWATFNLLIVESNAFNELKDNVRKKESLICAINADFNKKDDLKARGYRWSDGALNLPKSWWTTVSEECLDDELSWLDDNIYGHPGRAEKLPRKVITARNRYSYRAEVLD